MRIARRRLHLRVTQQFADHRESFAERERAARERVPKIMNANAIKSGFRANASPGVLQIGEVAALPRTCNDVGVVIDPLNAPQNRRRGFSVVNDLGAGFRIRQA
jgi:hypothetical protein